MASSKRRCSSASWGMSGRWCTVDRRPLERGVRGYVSADSLTRVERLRPGRPLRRAAGWARRAAPGRQRAGPAASVRAQKRDRRRPRTARAQRRPAGSADLGALRQQRAGGRRELHRRGPRLRPRRARRARAVPLLPAARGPGPVGAAPGARAHRDVPAPPAGAVPGPDHLHASPTRPRSRGRVAPGTIQEPGRRGARARGCASRPGRCAVTLRPDGGGLALVVERRRRRTTSCTSP